MHLMRVKLSGFWGGMDFVVSAQSNDKRSLSVPSCKLQQLKILWVRVVTIPRWRGQGGNWQANTTDNYSPSASHKMKCCRV